MDDAAIEAVLRREYAPPSPDEPVMAQAPSMQIGTPELPQLKGLGAYITELPAASKQALYDFLGQTIGTGVGIAGGLATGPAAPVMAPAGGAAGSLTGKAVARTIGPYIGGTGDEPSTAEQTIDAAAGAAGPVVGPLASKAGRGIARVLAGGGREGVERVAEKSAALTSAREKAVAAEHMADVAGREQQLKGRMLLAAPSAKADEAARTATLEALTAKSAQFEAVSAVPKSKAELEKALNRAVARATNNLQPFTKANVGLVSVATGVLHDPVSAIGIFAGGHALRGLHEVAARKLLTSDKFLTWSLGQPKQSIADTIGSLNALLASKTLDSGDQQAVTELRDALDGEGPDRETSKPAPKGDRRSDAPRDSRGRFAKPRLVMGENFSFADLARARREM
jgi:hypothetical protein